MTMNDTLRAAFAAAEKIQHDDSSPESEPRPQDDGSWQHVADAAEPLTRKTLQVRGLDEKAVLVSVKRRMFNPYKRDEVESRAYGAGNVSKHLFEGKENRVRKTLSKFTEVYTYVNDNTVPWTTGVRMLNIDHYFDFTSGLRGLIDAADKSVSDLVANWDAEVQADLDRLSKIALAKGKPQLADPSDYPSADEIADRFGVEVRYMPVPTTGDFRVAISDEDKASLQHQLEDAEGNAAKYVIQQMIDPMQRAISKLAVPIGTDGAIFRDSLIDNMVEVADRMEKVNVSNDPEVADQIDALKSLVGTYANNKDVLRSSQKVRETAAEQIGSLVEQMAGLA